MFCPVLALALSYLAKFCLDPGPLVMFCPDPRPWALANALLCPFPGLLAMFCPTLALVNALPFPWPWTLDNALPCPSLALDNALPCPDPGPLAMLRHALIVHHALHTAIKAYKKITRNSYFCLYLAYNSKRKHLVKSLITPPLNVPNNNHYKS